MPSNVAAGAGWARAAEGARWARMACTARGILHDGEDPQPSATAGAGEDIEVDRIGKSRLRRALAHEVRRRGFDVVFIDTEKLLTRLAGGRADGTHDRIGCRPAGGGAAHDNHKKATIGGFDAAVTIVPVRQSRHGRIAQLEEHGPYKPGRRMKAPR